MKIDYPLVPVFSNIPKELFGLSRWVTWRDKKIPYSPTELNSKASINDPDSWGSFTQAEAAYLEGGWLGIGIVLNGDGLVGIDIDRCVLDGIADSKALDLLHYHGLTYIEFSPSGTGLRAFGYADTALWKDGWPFKGVRGAIDGLNIEVYSNQRYLTITGHIIINQGIQQINDLPELIHKIRFTNLQKSTEEDSSNPLTSFVIPLYSSVGDDQLFSSIPEFCFPKSFGTRHRCLFDLARFLKGYSPDQPPETFRRIVHEWYQKSLPHINTKEFLVSWADFLTAWPKIKHPFGQQLNQIVMAAKKITEIPKSLIKEGYGDHTKNLIKICMALHQYHVPEPFFISARQAGKLIGIDFTDAAKILKALVQDEILVEVSKGVGRKASRYQFKYLEEV